jgi:hypothetical protein
MIFLAGRVPAFFYSGSDTVLNSKPFSQMFRVKGLA